VVMLFSDRTQADLEMNSYRLSCVSRTMYLEKELMSFQSMNFEIKLDNNGEQVT